MPEIVLCCQAPPLSDGMCRHVARLHDEVMADLQVLMAQRKPISQQVLMPLLHFPDHGCWRCPSVQAFVRHFVKHVSHHIEHEVTAHCWMSMIELTQRPRKKQRTHDGLKQFIRSDAVEAGRASRGSNVAALTGAATRAAVPHWEAEEMMEVQEAGDETKYI